MSKTVVTVGIDLARQVFLVHGVDAGGRTVLQKTVPRDQLHALVAQLPPCGSGWRRTQARTSGRGGFLRTATTCG